MTLEFHEYADIFPLLEGAALDELAADIEANGLSEPVRLLDGKILDGRNRYLALRSIDPNVHPDGDPEMFDEFRGDDALGWVISKNLHRRHLTTGQRAMVAARIASLRPGANQHTKQAPSIEDASAMVKVGHASVERARTVIEHGVPELGRAVEQGRVKVSAAAAIASLEPAEQEAALVAVGSPEWKASVKAARDQQTAMKKARRAIKERALGEKQRALPKEKFGVILADPEWKFETWSEAGMDRAADNHYPTSPADVIMARPVREVAADDCALFLWATGPMIETALTVLKAWGFTYKSQWVWVKEGAPGTGYWNRGDHEVLLLGTRGKVPCPAQGENWSSVLDGRKGRHSEKPEAAYELIEAYFPSLPKIELNARGSREGWTAWGNEAPEAGDGDQGSGIGSGPEDGDGAGRDERGGAAAGGDGSASGSAAGGACPVDAGGRTGVSPGDPPNGSDYGGGGAAAAGEADDVDAGQVKLRRLTDPQRLALAALAEAPLLRQRHGWANLSVLHGFSTQTIEALGRHGLARVEPLGGCSGRASITAAGQQQLAAGEAAA